MLEKSVSNNDTNEDKKKYRRFIIILLILLFISWVFIIDSGIAKMKSDKKNKADIFEIQCGTNCDCDLDGPNHNVNPPGEDLDGDNQSPDDDQTPSDDNNGEGNDIPTGGEENGEIDVSDKNVKWRNSDIYHLNNKLKIFENPVYDGESIIAPLSSNTYKFIIKNATGYVVDYKLDFLEENQYNINMKYRLRKNGYYVAGNEEEWVSYEKLSVVFENISKGNVDNYELDWKWFESDNDTQIGAVDANYILTISITAVDSTKYE